MTGFPEYSINSHNYRPIDFLVKPIDKHRLLESIAIAHDMIESDKIVKQAKVYDSIFTYKFRKSINMLNRSEEHTSELQSRQYLVCRLLLEKKKSTQKK